jgi:mRNA interferase MazF
VLSQKSGISSPAEAVTFAVSHTSNPYADERAVMLENQYFRSGGLHRLSYARLGKLFTADTAIMAAEVGVLEQPVYEKVLQAVIDMLEGR